MCLNFKIYNHKDKYTTFSINTRKKNQNVYKFKIFRKFCTITIIKIKNSKFLIMKHSTGIIFLAIFLIAERASSKNLHT